MKKTLTKLKDLLARAGKWLGLAQPQPTVTSAVVADRFDTMSWQEVYEQADALRDLADELTEHYDYTADLLRDMFLAAYKATPQLRRREEMDTSRIPNHQIVAAMMNAPEYADLHRETAGDPYAAAMAVLSQADALRRMLKDSRTAREHAQQAKDAQNAEQEAAEALTEALAQATRAADEDGTVPEEEASAVRQTADQADAAGQEAEDAARRAAQSLVQAAPGIRTAARRALNEAVKEAQEEAALMRAWGVSPGQLERMPYAERAQLAQRLRSGRIGQFAELVGRFRQMAIGERDRRVENAPGELVGITLGDDLTRVVPSELAQLGIPALRAVFAARYADAQLMQYDSRGEQHTGQGAIIACIDTSFSMSAPLDNGITGEAWAKACALALLDQARAARRDFVGILFSSENEVSVHPFPASRPIHITDVINFAETFYAGGTDFEAPLTNAADLLDAEFNADGRPRGDIVLITDGECDVTEDWMRGWNDAKHQLGFRCFGIAIGTSASAEPGSVLDALCDNLRTLSALTDTRQAADLFRLI